MLQNLMSSDSGKTCRSHKVLRSWLHLGLRGCCVNGSRSSKYIRSSTWILNLEWVDVGARYAQASQPSRGDKCRLDRK